MTIILNFMYSLCSIIPTIRNYPKIPYKDLFVVWKSYFNFSFSRIFIGNNENFGDPDFKVALYVWKLLNYFSIWLNWSWNSTIEVQMEGFKHTQIQTWIRNKQWPMVYLLKFISFYHWESFCLITIRTDSDIGV